jgi:hypothetical protein
LAAVAAKTQWTSAAVPLNLQYLMKCGTTNAVLTFVLSALAVLGVVLVLRTVIQTRELRTMGPQVAIENSYLTQAQMLLGDVAAYNKAMPSPELTKLLQSLPKPAATK